MSGIPKRLRLIEEHMVERRLYEIKRLLSRRYSVRFIGRKSLCPDILYSTESSLESDKLGLVLKAILFDKYYAPIIVVRGSHGRLYILDGHHRARVYLWLRELVDAYLLEALAYSPRVSVPLKDIAIVNPPVNLGEPYRTLRHMVNIIHFLEQRHGLLARVWRERIYIYRLYATQQIVRIKKGSPETLWIPPLIYRYRDEYYVVDGHSRICSLLLSGTNIVDSIVFTLSREIGLIRTSKTLGSPRFTEVFCIRS